MWGKGLDRLDVEMVFKGPDRDQSTDVCVCVCVCVELGYAWLSGQSQR